MRPAPESNPLGRVLAQERQSCASCRHLDERPDFGLIAPWADGLCTILGPMKGRDREVPVTKQSGTLCLYYQPRYPPP